MRELPNKEESKTEAIVSFDPGQPTICLPVTESLRVLVTDDNTTNRKLLRVVLEAENHVVLEADNGISALQLLDQTEVDAVISDILMPEMDGYRLCYEIRKNPKLRRLPFIVYTASYTSSSDEKVAIQFGVDKFLRKPASGDEILKSLHEVLAAAKIHTREELQIPEEAEAMREYSQVLVRKLEETIVDLSAANQTLQTLHELSQKILNTLDLQKILQEFLDKALSIGPFDLGVIRLFEPNNKSLRVAATKGYVDDKNINYLTMALTQEAIGVNLSQVISQRKTLIAENVPESEGWGSFKREGVRAAIMFPIWTEDEILGIVQLGSRKSQKIPSRDASLLEALASQAGIAIQKARLYEQTQRNFERIKALHEIDLAITSTLDLRQSLDVLLEKIDIFLPFPAATTIRLFDAASQKFKNTACRNIDEQEWKPGTGRGTGQLSHEFLKTKGPVIIPNIQTDIERKSSEFFRKHGFVSYIGVPLIVKGNLVGVLGFYTREAHEFTQQEIDFLTTLAGQAAIAIHNARLYEETERRRREAEELARVARSLTENLDPTAVGERILTSVRELFGVQGSTLRLRQADGSFQRLASSGQVFSQTSAGDAVPSGVGLTNRAIAQGKPIWSSDILNDPEIVLTDEMRDYQIRSGNRSMIVVPLCAHEKLIGTLTLSDRTGRIYSDNEVALLQTFADQVALALENARLFERNEVSKRELETTNKFLDRLLNQLASLYTAMTPLALSESLGEMLKGILERLIEATGADAALVRILDRKAGNYPVIGHMGYSREFIEDARPEGAEGAIGLVIQYGEPVIAPDIASDDRLKRKGQLEMGFQSCAMLPLRVHSEVSGVVQISSRKRRYFDEEQKDHLLAVARQMGVALENRELFYSLKASRDDLERANRVKDEFLSVMSHELRTPLSVVLGYSRMFQDRQLGPLTKEQQQAVEVVLRNSQELLEMIESIMDATKIEAGSMTAEVDPVSPVQLLEEIKGAYDFPIAKNVRLEWQFPESLPLLWSDSRKVRQILTNLINNAVKFTEEGRVVIAAEEKRKADEKDSERWIEFRVTDSGVGIPPAECDKIFDRFHQVDSSKTRRFEGVGLGLYIVKSFTEMLGGRVSVCSELGKGSTFTVSLPV